MAKIAEVGPRLGVRPTCKALGAAPASYYRFRRPRSPAGVRSSPRALSGHERQDVLDVLHEPRFADQAVAEVHATLLDEGRYLCSERTMYRILADREEVRERRNQLRHPNYTAPELMATAPNELWSWDITKLKGPVKWTYFYLYVILDVFSRFVVGWMVAQQESAALAKRLIGEACKRQGVSEGQLTLHADRGPSMRSKAVALLLSDLGVTKTHSRPYTSTDNPFSEAQFRTMKYRPEFPDRFGCLQHSRSFCGSFFSWYNMAHRHGGLAMLTPHDVHHGLGTQRLADRARVLAAAYSAHPERFPHGIPTPGALPLAVWINKPKEYGCEEENELARSAVSADREKPRGRIILESDLSGPRAEESSFVVAH